VADTVLLPDLPDGQVWRVSRDTETPLVYRVDLCSVMSMSGGEPSLVPLVSGSVTTTYEDSPDTIVGAIYGEASVLLTQIPVSLPLGNVTFGPGVQPA